MLACLLLLRDDDDGSGRGGGAREGCVDEGGKQAVRGRRSASDHKTKGRAAQGQGPVVVVVVVVVVPAGVGCCQVQQRRRTTTLHGAWKEADKSSCSFSEHY